METTETNGKIQDVEYSDIMQKSYIDYAMSVIVARAIPDVKDGLKPVQRRIIYDMNELNASSDKPYRKSARIVGDTMGKYHPHGDSSIYEALVVMTQDFKKNTPLVDGHGNFGSIEGDGAAAMRYTESRLEEYTERIFLEDLKTDTVDFCPNYDNTEKEPKVLPCKVPNILINGSEGVAVGMTTSIPPHNLGEVLDASVYFLDHPEAETKDIMPILPGPDFPTGGIVSNRADLPSIYESGSGKIKIRGKIEFEQGKGKEKDKLVITEIPYTIIGEGILKFIQQIAALVEDKTLTDITDISNQTSSEGIRIVLELRKNADAEYIKNVLYKKTKLEDTFGVNMLCICDGKPKTLGITGILNEFCNFQYELCTKKYQYLLSKALKKKEIDEGLIKAVDVIDVIIAVLRGSKTIAAAKECLMTGSVEKISFKNKAVEKQAKSFCFTEPQAAAILEMRLSRLIGLELDALQKDYDKIVRQIKEYEKILSSKLVMKNHIKKELMQIKEKYARERKTEISNLAEIVIPEKEEEEKEIIALIDRFGYIHSVDTDVYSRNNREKTGDEQEKLENVEQEWKYTIPLSSKSKLLIFTDSGKVYSIKASSIPGGKYKDKGVPLENLSDYDGKKETILYITGYPPAEEELYLVMLSTNNAIKRVSIHEFDTSRRTIDSTKFTEPGEKLLAIYEYDENGFIEVSTDMGYLKFRQTDIPVNKRISRGSVIVKGDAKIIITASWEITVEKETGAEKHTGPSGYNDTVKTGKRGNCVKKQKNQK